MTTHSAARAAVLALLLAAPFAEVAAMKFDFTGEIAFDGLGFLRGDAVSGSVVFDDTLSDASPGGGFGLYGDGIVTHYSLTVGGHTVVATALAGSDVVVDIDRTGQDRVSFRNLDIAFDGAVSPCDDAATCNSDLVFIDPSELIVAANSPVDALPTPAQLAAFPVAFGNINAGGGNVQFNIETLTPVGMAEPAAALLLAVGLLGLAARRRAW